MAGSWPGCLRIGPPPLRLLYQLRLSASRTPIESFPAGGWDKLPDSVTQNVV